MGSLDVGRDRARGGVGVVLALAKPSTQLLLFLLRVGREVLGGAVFALQKVGDQDIVLVGFLTGGQDVGALDRLVREAEDVVDGDDALGGIRRAGDI